MSSLYKEIETKMVQIAATSVKEFIEKNPGVENSYPCGFARVIIEPKHKGNTTLGKLERKEFEVLGFEKDYCSKNYMRLNPSGHPTQNMYVKEAGAKAAADFLTNLGYKAYSASRMD